MADSPGFIDWLLSGYMSTPGSIFYFINLWICSYYREIWEDRLRIDSDKPENRELWSWMVDLK